MIIRVQERTCRYRLSSTTIIEMLTKGMAPNAVIFKTSLRQNTGVTFVAIPLNSQRVCAPLTNKLSHPGRHRSWCMMMKCELDAGKNDGDEYVNHR